MFNNELNRTNNAKYIYFIYHNDTMIQDPTELANIFNSYFIEIGSNLADQMSPEETFISYLNEDFHLNFKLNQIDEMKVSMVIKRLKNMISCGLYDISNSLIKNSSDVLSNPLTSGIFYKKNKNHQILSMLSWIN